MNMRKKNHSIESIAVLLMCLYTLMMYLTYIDTRLEKVNSVVLYAFLGMSVIALIVRRKITFNRYWVWYLGFIVISIVSTFYTPNPGASVGALYGLVVVFGLTFAMSIIFTDRVNIERFMRCLVFGSLLLIIYLMITGQLNVDTETGERLGKELTGNANTFATIYMIAACSSVYLLLSDRKVVFKIFYIVTFALQMYGLALSGGKKFFAIPFVVLFITLLFKKDNRGKKHVILYAVLGAAVAFVLFYALLNIPILYNTVGHRFESFFEYSTGLSKSSDASTIEREYMRARAMDLWAQSPVFGNGYNAFTQIGGWNVYSHCNYTELLCNYGIVGLLYYYYFWAYSLYSLIKVKSNHTMRHFLIAIMISLLLFDFGAVSFSAPFTLYFILMASLVGEKPQKYLDER